MIKKQTVVLLNRAFADVWILMTEEEIQALRDRDAAAGRWHDEGGEPIIYGPYSGWPREEFYDNRDLRVTITSTRPKWLGWRKRPKGLRAGWCEELEREILFRERV